MGRYATELSRTLKVTEKNRCMPHRYTAPEQESRLYFLTTPVTVKRRHLDDPWSFPSSPESVAAGPRAGIFYKIHSAPNTASEATGSSCISILQERLISTHPCRSCVTSLASLLLSRCPPHHPNATSRPSRRHSRPSALKRTRSIPQSTTLIRTMDTTIKTLSGSITQANSDASGSDTFGIVDSVTILCNVYSIIPKLEAALQNLIDQQSGFTLLHLLLAPIALLIEADLLAVKTAAAALENSMLNKTQGVQVPMQSAFDELSATIDNAISTYSLLGLLK
ncbi:hypothetical protein PENSPDRAFT_385797 [Peniophora sp. CONT]|nr:hypothetical protein PENSPDRAFT_385797 [Peniophora sp. CONT]